MSSLHPAPTPRTPPATSPPQNESSPHKSGIDRHLWEIRPIRDLFILGALVGLLWFLFELHHVFLPVFIAFLLAYLVNPFVDYAFTHWTTPRPVTVGILMLFLALAGVGIGLWLIPLLMEQTETLIQKIPIYTRSLSQRYETLFGSWSISLGDLLGRLHEDPLATIQPLLLGTGQAFGFLGQLLGLTANVALYTILIPVYFFFFSWHFESMSRTIVRLIPVSRRPQILQLSHRMDTVVRGFFFERLLIAAITGVLYAGGWSLVGVPYWFLLGVVTGLASLVPYLSAIGWPVAVALKYADALTSGHWATTEWMTIVLWPSVAYLIVQFVEGWVLTPWLQRHSTDMSAVTILIVVFMGGAIGGLFGLIFAIPVAACLKILIEEFVRPRWIRWVRES